MNAAPCIDQTTTDGRRYVSVFEDPGSTMPTRNIVYAPNGSVEYDSNKDINTIPSIP